MSLQNALKLLSSGADRVIETSCATIILKNDTAYKLKKSVDFGFLDFTSPEKRRTALERELLFNQRTAADIYKEVREVEGEAVLVMRRFDTSGVLAERSTGTDWSPDMDLMQELGEGIARFHAGAEVCRDEQHVENIKYVIDSNDENISRFKGALTSTHIAAYRAEIQAAYHDVEGLVRRRFAEGRVRRCHGDLHLGNILIEDGRPVLFDCIEFNERLSWIDVLYDLGFLLMDLWVRGQSIAANRVMNAWLEQAARSEGETGLYEGLKLLPLFMSVRAGVRCHVSANNGEMDQARMYLDAARSFLGPVDAAVTAVGGLSGSGKSTYARAIAAEKGRAPGAVVLRSDELRKRLWNWPPFEPLPREAYAAEETRRTYTHLFTLGRVAVQAGQSVILDATFREAHWRDEAEASAAEAAVRFDGVWLNTDRETRRQRVSGRLRDVSDATPDIAAAQEVIEPAAISWQILNQTGEKGDDMF
jgi:uncharacterized protein